MYGQVKALILNFNNYFNRIIKIRNTKAEYLEYGYEYQDPINFEPNDGVNTSHIFNISLGTTSPDYIVILDDQDNIVSRWFVIEQVRTREGQYKLDLRRDLIVDYNTQFLNSKSFIQRGYIPFDGTLPNQLIYNQEFMKFNKIKTDEWVLYNADKTPWIVLYFSRAKSDGTGAVYEDTFNFSEQDLNIKYSYKIDYNSTGPAEIYTSDAEFEIFGIPYVDRRIKYYDSELHDFKEIFQIKEDALLWANAIISKYSGSGFLYDAQIVPYVRLIGVDNEYIAKYSILTQHIEGYNPVEKVVGFKLNKSKFSINVENQNITHLPDLKESNELEFYRITSPNGVGNYDYSMAKNLFYEPTKFNVDVTLKPINPYIKINPIYYEFGLYGKDYNDYRGLICGGNFSLSIYNNQWLTYELNNKNYQTMFNREIETLDQENNINLIRDIASTAGGAVGGAASGAVTGGLIGGPVGAAIGGVIGGAASAGAGAADVIMNEKERQLNKQLKIDMFNMSHENVKSRAVGLTRSTLFNINNKIFPYIEHYKCTSKEILYFRNYINLRSYNIGVYDKPINYKYDGKFIQGSIIDIDISEDYHLVEAMNDYFEIGFRFEEQGE